MMILNLLFWMMPSALWNVSVLFKAKASFKYSFEFGVCWECFFNVWFIVPWGWILFLLFFLGLVACEGALGLSMLVSVVRTHGNYYFNSFNSLQC